MIQIKNMCEFYYRSQVESKIADEIFEEWHAITKNDFENAADYRTPLMELYGGDIFIVETEEDLKEVITPIIDFDETDTFFNITDIATAYDDARYLASGKFAVLYIVTSNSGGPTYYIPREIADKYRTIEESIKMSNDGDLRFFTVS